MRIDPENPVLNGMSSAFDVLAAALLFLLCCLPVVTIPASVAAMYSTILAIVEGRCSGILGQFFSSFRRDFKLAAMSGLVLLAAGMVLAMDVYVCWGLSRTPSTMRSAMRGLTVVCGIIYTAVSAYTFAGAAKFNVNWRQALGNGFFWTFRFPLHTLGILSIGAIVTAVCLLAWVWSLPMLSLGLYLQGCLFSSAFRITLEKAQALSESGDGKERAMTPPTV